MAKAVLFSGNWCSRTWASWGLVAALCLSGQAISGTALALGKPTDLQAIEPSPDDVSAAARYFDEGRTAFKQERYIEAAEAFEKADALAPNAKVLLLAIQSRELGGHVSRAATLAALASQRHAKDELFADIGTLLKTARTEFNFVTVACDDPCQVMVGNRLIHGAPGTRRFLFLEQGSYRIRATWSNGQSLSKYYEAEAGKKGRLSFDSSNQGASTAPAPQDDETAAERSPQREESSSSTPEETDSPRESPPASQEPDEDYWADGEVSEEADGDPPDDPFEASAEAAQEPAVEDEETPSNGWSPVVFWVAAGATVVLAGASTWSGIHTLNNPGREAVVANCVGQGELCPTYQEGLRNQDRTNILWTVTASMGAISGLIGLFFTDWGGDATDSKQGAAKNEPRVAWRLHPLVGLEGRSRGNSTGVTLTGSYLTATGRF